MAITIKNQLEVFPGNIINVPGKEPISAITSTTLAANTTPTASIISLESAMTLIPDAQIVITYNPTRRFFVLPSGPASVNCPCVAVEDYYKLLRDNAQEIPVNTTTSQQDDDGDCDVFPLPDRCKVF